MSDVEQMLIDINFYAQAVSDSKRTLVCHPSMLDAIQEAVDAHELAGVYSVRSSPICPESRLMVLDEQAMEASFRQTVQRSARSLYPYS